MPYSKLSTEEYIDVVKTILLKKSIDVRLSNCIIPYIVDTSERASGSEGKRDEYKHNKLPYLDELMMKMRTIRALTAVFWFYSNYTVKWGSNLKIFQKHRIYLEFFNSIFMCSGLKRLN